MRIVKLSHCVLSMSTGIMFFFLHDIYCNVKLGIQIQIQTEVSNAPYSSMQAKASSFKAKFLALL